MINVKVDGNKAIDMLINRLAEFWKLDDEDISLFTKMYENYIYNYGCFEGMEFDPKIIVDNDYINYCKIIHEDDDYFETIKSIYNENGLTDVSCETVYSHIEAVNEDETAFLMRYR